MPVYYMVIIRAFVEYLAEPAIQFKALFRIDINSTKHTYKTKDRVTRTPLICIRVYHALNMVRNKYILVLSHITSTLK
jgi:hypothetical protein